MLRLVSFVVTALCKLILPLDPEMLLIHTRELLL